MFLRVVSNGTTGAGNGAPSAATDGVPVRRGASGQTANQGLPEDVDECSVLIEGVGTASATNSIAYVRLWGYFPDAVGVSSSTKWFPLGTGADSDKGKLNGTTITLGETTADTIRHTERVRGLAECQRIYAEYGALTSVTRVDITLVASGRGRT